MDPIEYVTTKALLKELRKRHDTMVFLAASNRTNEVEDVTVAFEGAFHSVIGLIELGRSAVMNGISNDEDGPSN
jgi:hypothetical protein|tara:strand:- start:23773 stop:23994 length:222 start_codon:yes stop_codon:yes gene_type:complete